jgi:alkanesulfonate monooxygenase SsuD/methylene tetrahydromethanopterin reductase-like flavin-dependent oxidoreductase (luciferase family)
MPIWIGGESEATMQTVKELGDGWMMLSAGGKPETLRKVLSDPDWPKRPMTLVKGGRIVVAETHDEAIRDAQTEYETLKRVSPMFAPPSFEEFLEREIAGTPDECLAKLDELEALGVNYLRMSFNSDVLQQRVARLIIPRLGEVGRAPSAG